MLVSGCAMSQLQKQQGEQLNVFGIELFSTVDYRQIGSVTAVEEPCLKGYERSFDPLDVTIGYGFNNIIRKITTRNRSTSMYGIIPGMALVDGQQRAERAGFSRISPYIFHFNDLSLTLLADSNDILFGITVERID